jgi:hypothetical protein
MIAVTTSFAQIVWQICSMKTDAGVVRASRGEAPLPVAVSAAEKRPRKER